MSFLKIYKPMIYKAGDAYTLIEPDADLSMDLDASGLYAQHIAFDLATFTSTLDLDEVSGFRVNLPAATKALKGLFFMATNLSAAVDGYANAEDVSFYEGETLVGKIDASKTITLICSGDEWVSLGIA